MLLRVNITFELLTHAHFSTILFSIAIYIGLLCCVYIYMLTNARVMLAVSYPVKTIRSAYRMYLLCRHCFITAFTACLLNFD